MRRIKELISKKQGVGKTATAAFFCAKAEEIIQKVFETDRIKVKKFHNQTLFLRIENPSVAQKVFNQQEQIIKRLKEELKEPITRLSYRVED